MVTWNVTSLVWKESELVLEVERYLVERGWISFFGAVVQVVCLLLISQSPPMCWRLSWWSADLQPYLLNTQVKRGAKPPTDHQLVVGEDP